MQGNRVIAGLLALLALLACKKDKSGQAGSPCSSDADCNNGLLCESGACMAREAAEKIRGSTASGSSGAGDTCARAVACCKAVAAKTGSAATANCDNYAKVGDAVCATVLDNWSKAGRAVGVSCDGTAASVAEAPVVEPKAESPPSATAGCKAGLTRMANGKCFAACLDDSDCPEGTGCTGSMKRADNGSSTKVCLTVKAKKGQGEACGRTSDCASGLFCCHFPGAPYATCGESCPSGEVSN